MRFNAEASDLNAGMSLVSHAISARPIREVFSNVQVECACDGLFFTAMDGEMTIRTRVEATIAEEGIALLPAKIFADLLRTLSGSVDITIGNDFRATVRAMGSHTSLAGTDAAEFPDVNSISDKECTFEVTLPQSRLRDAVSSVSFAIATDETRRILTGCLMEAEPHETRFVGLDGFRLALQRIENENRLPDGSGMMSAVIPGRIMTEFCRMLGDSEESAVIRCAAKRMCMSFNNTECYSTLLSGEYINYRQILPSGCLSQAVVRKDELTKAIERASLMARLGRNNLLRLSLTREEMAISANSEVGSAHETISVNYSADEFKIAFNARYLSDVVRNVESDEMVMKFNTGISPCTITPVEGNSFIYLVLPVRVVNEG